MAKSKRPIADTRTFVKNGKTYQVPADASPERVKALNDDGWFEAEREAVPEAGEPDSQPQND